MLWPLVLLAPFVPGLPRPEPSGLPWRQELLLALLLMLTSALLLKRASGASSPSFSAFKRTYGLNPNRLELLLISTLALYVLWSALSLAWASNPYPVLHYSLSWGGYLLFFLFMRGVAGRARLLALSLAAFAAVILIISLASVIGSMGAPISLFRYNGLGEPLAVSIPLMAALALSVRRKRIALVCGATALLSWLAMLQAFERTPFLSTTTGLILLGLQVLFFPQLRRRMRLRRAWALLACFILLAAFQFMPARLSSITVGAEPPHTTLSRLKTTGAEDENTQSRLLFWGVAIELWRAHPLKGVGANHYAIAFPEGRAAFAASHTDSKLSALNEGHLAVLAHNEYLQILSELGLVGLLLFALFAAVLVWAAWLALKRARSPLAPGAISALAVFAINSGASSVSFRWLGSGLIFFFAAALVARFARGTEVKEEKPARARLSQTFTRRATACAFLFALLMFSGISMQALNVTEHGRAQSSKDAALTDSGFRKALFWNPLDGATHFNYGIRLFHQGRYQEAVQHLRYGIDNGMNTSVCYGYLAAAQMKSGQMEHAAGTLKEGLRVYPVSIFLRVRLATVLSKSGKEQEAAAEMARAISIREDMARGWWELINSGKDAAMEAAKAAPDKVGTPGSLLPRDAVFLVLSENRERAPTMDFNREGLAVASDTR